MVHLAQIFLVGIVATAVMDLWLLLLKWINIPTINFALLGRWIGHLFRGRLVHAAIGKTQPIAGEELLGWGAHYAIGIGFAALLLVVCGAEWTRAPTLAPALSIGVITVMAPLFVMQPAMGSGFASSKTPTPFFNCAKSLINHTVFGAGLYVGAVVANAILSPFY